MVKYKLVYTRQAQKDAKKLNQSGLKEKTIDILTLLGKDPFQSFPPFEKLAGDLTGAYSRRLNIQYRIVYQVYKEERIIKIIRLWTHYE
ncbi:MAG: Txe/YoeB family addiction module toxin [Spirochaetota bacterium]